MAITKTKFINYTRCKRYVALDNLETDKLDSDITFEEYKEEENSAKLEELLGSMYEDDNNLLDEKNEQMEIMLPYYNEIEILAGNIAKKYFKGKFKFAYNTTNQESFDCKINNIRYICYVDIYNEIDNYFNIIEVKATTSKKFLSLGGKKNGVKNSIFKEKNGIYYLLPDLNLNIEDYMSLKEYNNALDKLYDRYSNVGHYIYDLAVQRYIIEWDLKQNNEEYKIDNIKYYLAVLNDSYVYDGEIENGKCIYDTDDSGNDIITYFDVSSITRDYLDVIDSDRKKLEGYINQMDGNRCDIGEFCEYKKTTHCRYNKLCFDILPEKNSILTYLDNHQGFKFNDIKYDRYELINKGMVSITDVPLEYLNREKNRIQREVILTHKPYFNKNKIKDGINEIKYPIYHLDFETFPCPLPRFYGERPYTQSVFQFSLHIEKESGICDKIKDHYGYLSPDNLDHREELIEEMIKYIDTSCGTVLVYNDSFEKSRLAELALIFPQYKEKLLKIKDMVFDLMNITKTKTSLYEALGYSKEEAGLFNYYHEDLNGSYSIKKFLPLFSNLTYKGMEVSNGVEALVTYAKFGKMSKTEYDYMYQKLVEYCLQDTWAMVEILWGLKESVK